MERLEDGEVAILARHECKTAVLLDIFLPPPKPLFPLDYVKKKITRPNTNLHGLSRVRWSPSENVCRT